MVLLVCEQLHRLRRCDRRPERLVHAPHDVVERREMLPPNIDLLIVVSLGGSAKVMPEDIIFDIFKPREAASRL